LSTASALEKINKEAQGFKEDNETTIQIARNLSKTSTTFGANIALSNNKPAVPTIGGLTALSKDEWSAWTGGKPKADWSGLADQPYLGQHVSESAPSNLRFCCPERLQLPPDWPQGHLQANQQSHCIPKLCLEPPHQHWHGFYRLPQGSLDATKMTNIVKSPRPLHRSVGKGLD
jgi:hypothetical protein